MRVIPTITRSSVTTLTASLVATFAICLLLGGCYDEMEQYTSVQQPMNGNPESGEALI